MTDATAMDQTDQLDLTDGRSHLSPTIPATPSTPAMPAASYVELHCRRAFSFLRGGSSVEALVARAAALGMRALALTDYMTLVGVQSQYGCQLQLLRSA